MIISILISASTLLLRHTPMSTEYVSLHALAAQDTLTRAPIIDSSWISDVIARARTGGAANGVLRVVGTVRL